MSTALTLFTIIHVLISLVAIVAGFVVLSGWLQGKDFPSWTRVFLWNTLATTVTGFMFPFHGFTPAFVTGIVSLLLLTPVFLARYRFHMVGGWRKTYVIAGMAAFYLNVFVLVVQLFQKVPALHALAPTQTETPFKAAQSVVLLAFIALGVIAVKKFKASPALS